MVLRAPQDRASTRLDVRVVLVCGALSVAAAGAIALNVGYGEVSLSLGEVIATLLGGGDAGNRFIVLDLRLPRSLVAALAGVALALSGVVFQTLARNPLASPDVIGITSGASVAGVAAFVLGGSAGLAPVAAGAGALAAAGCMYLLAWRGGLSPFRMILVGIGIAAIGHAGTSYILIQGRVEDVQQAYVWLVGSVNLRNWADFRPLLVGLVALLPLVAMLARPLDALALGEDSARTLGVPVERARLGLVVTGAALAAIGVAAAGPIGFVGFVAPLIARRLTGRAGAAVLPAAALCGAALVPAADLAGRFLFAPTQIPVGIVTAILGAPVFLYLLFRSNRRRRVA